MHSQHAIIIDFNDRTAQSIHFITQIILEMQSIQSIITPVVEYLYAGKYLELHLILSG